MKTETKHTPTLEIGQTMTIQGDEMRTIKSDGLIVAFVSDGNLKDTTARDALAERIVQSVNRAGLFDEMLTLLRLLQHRERLDPDDRKAIGQVITRAQEPKP